jgi:hypothetical protein
VTDFGEVAWDLGARNLNDLPAYADPFHYDQLLAKRKVLGSEI